MNRSTVIPRPREVEDAPRRESGEVGPLVLRHSKYERGEDLTLPTHHPSNHPHPTDSPVIPRPREVEDAPRRESGVGYSARPEQHRRASRVQWGRSLPPSLIPVPRHRNPSSSSPSTKLEAYACASAQAYASVFFSPSPLKALRERGTKGERVPPGRRAGVMVLRKRWNDPARKERNK